MSFWRSDRWLAYERALGCEGERTRVLADATWRTRVVDLGPAEDELWRGVRRSYHSLINKLDKDDAFRVELAAGVDVTTVCRHLHALEAGRDTRPMSTWHLQRAWLEVGGAACLVAQRAGNPVGFAYAVVDGAWAYYFSAASVEPNVQHALQWRMIRLLKAAGLERYELGWQGQAEDEKGRAIEFFRRGFGGTDVPASEGA